ncbi:uncharacterized protein LOC112179069 isoform X1 [Rosa chinensis]|uniref:uncharacterized protein LOC112179069 isoform X1 n=1 Tax=Rosa chinensis TaxID=74649 RepID=UPI001AD90CCC|nr:uncharacterized protein LOC112179069 isoform X1 [Rosa chinensis]
MQRQSLGSPVSKLHQAHGGDDTLIHDDKRSKDILAFSASSSSSPPDFDDNKATKPHRLSSPPPITPDKVIHVIPILTVLCFLILFLFSHTPSQSGTTTPSLPHSSHLNQRLLLFSAKSLTVRIFLLSDLAQFNGFTRLSAPKRVDSVNEEIGDIRRFIDVRKTDALAIRSLRDLGSETRKLTPRSRSHRKIADF